ncbi:MAG TPA: chorismate-binding protein [Chloroflexota bacterium]|nr:chorismate-binding protein [Chloroflexota bacterium]
MRVLASPSATGSGETRFYAGAYDPLATYRRLRDAGVLGAYSYLHVTADRAEIGWAPLARLRLLDHQPAPDWRARLQAFADGAAALGRKAFGYVGFDAVDQPTGTLPDGSQSGWPLVEFVVPGELVTFDGAAAVHWTQGSLDLARYLAVAPAAPSSTTAAPLDASARLPGEQYVEAVRQATEALRAGEARKVVLSRYQAYDVAYDAADLFANYCLTQAFVDAFLVDFGGLTAVVASPEMLLSASGGTLETNPLAGTRPRGATPDEDARLREELRYHPKEIAEHVLSVTTQLEELGPVCAPASPVVCRLLDVCLQQKVQHLSSLITGRLAPERAGLEALWALFPSVTVSGLPKSAALPLLRRLEGHPRGLYAGAFGWVTGRADARFALAIRGIFRYGRRTFLQAGAGIMPDSVPEAELAETAHKLRAMEDALARTVAAARTPPRIFVLAGPVEVKA